MERKIGETFEFEGKKIEVRAASRACDGCFLEEKCCIDSAELLGTCGFEDRTDKKDVIFVEVQEQPQETEEIKGRKVGEVFEYQGKKFKVAEELVQGDCVGCYFFEKYDCGAKRRIIGECEREKRNDNQGIIFVDIIDDLKKRSQEQAEQPQDEQPQKLNLCEILKDCPKRTEFWSDDYGIVRFDSIFIGADTPIRVTRPDEHYSHYTKEGWHCKEMPGSCLLWPSRDCRDWSKFTAPWYKKEESIKPKFKVGDIIRHKETNKDDVYEISKVYDDSYGIVGFNWGIYIKYQDQYELIPNKFDPKTLKAFDRVIVWDEINAEWFCANYSHRKKTNIFIAATTCGNYLRCIPYNDDTKHLVGTTDEAPEFYKYWED